MILLRTMTVGFTLRKVMPQQVEDADPRAGGERLNPQPEVPGHDEQRHDDEENPDETEHQKDLLRSHVDPTDRNERGRETFAPLLPL